MFPTSKVSIRMSFSSLQKQIDERETVKLKAINVQTIKRDFNESDFGLQGYHPGWRLWGQTKMKKG